jgi:hypothetical protein
MRIGAVGSRRRNSKADYELLESEILRHYKHGDYIISGGCTSGADAMAEKIARAHGWWIVIYHAKWQDPSCPESRRVVRENGTWYDPRAGFARNKFIAKQSQVLIALVAEDRKGGTEDTIKQFKEFLSLKGMECHAAEPKDTPVSEGSLIIL